MRGSITAYTILLIVILELTKLLQCFRRLTAYGLQTAGEYIWATQSKVGLDRYSMEKSGKYAYVYSILPLDNGNVTVRNRFIFGNLP